MAYAKRGEKFFDLSGGFIAQCWREKTRNGFRHLAVLRHEGIEVNRSKVCYLNRTWERYEYESVLERLVEGLPQQVRAVAEYKEPNTFGPVVGLMKLAEIMTDKPEDTVELKARAVFAIPGIIRPDNWDSLSVEEKAKRLAKIEKFLADEKAGA